VTLQSDGPEAVIEVLRCPKCRQEVEFDVNSVACRTDGTVATLRGHVLDFASERSQLDEQLVSFWDSSSEYYAATQSANAEISDDEHETHRRLIDAIPRDAALILDVGCGTAEAAQHVAASRQDATYVGVDVSLHALQLASQAGRPGIFVRAEADRLPFADGTFGGVFSFFALEHFTAPREVLEEMCRVLKPGGVLALLSVSYDRPLGVVPSRRFGGTYRGRRLPRLNPMNLAVYGKNRARFMVRQGLKHVRYRFDATYTVFERIERPLALDMKYVEYSDIDAVHVVSGTSVLRVLQQAGLEIIETTVPRPGSLRIPWTMLAVARRP
jgi:SAM-dependent methyltransferase